MNLLSYSNDILNEAQKILSDNMKNEDLNWSEKLTPFKKLKIINNFKYCNGLPKNEFFKRLIIMNKGKPSSKNISTPADKLYESFSKLDNLPKVGSIELKVIEINEIMNIIKTQKSNTKTNLCDWIMENDKLIGSCIVNCLIDESMYLVCECCYMVTVMIQLLKQGMPLFIGEAIVKGCIDAISMRFDDHENYIIYYRKINNISNLEHLLGNDKQSDMENFHFLTKGRELRAVNCALYTLCFLFEYNINPILLVFFQNRISMRKEVSRFYLFDLYYYVIKHMEVWFGDYKEQLNKLPLKLYIDLAKIPTENNSIIKSKMDDIIHELEGLSSFKFPGVKFSINHYSDTQRLKENEPKSQYDKSTTIKSTTFKTFFFDNKMSLDHFEVNIMDNVLLPDNNIYHRESLELGHFQSMLLKTPSNIKKNISGIIQ